MLPPLATPQDATLFGYCVTAPQLARASARVRGFTKQQISLGTSTHIVIGQRKYLLPQRPVVEITEVKDHADFVLPVSAYHLDGQFLHLPVGGTPWIANGPCYGGTKGAFRVTYDHGFEVLPDELIEVVCSIASRLTEQPEGLAAGARTEQAGGETVTWGTDAFAAVTDLTRAEKDVLRRIFPRLPRTVSLWG